MQISATINALNQLHASHLSRKPKTKAFQASNSLKNVLRDLEGQSMGEYILSNIHSNRKDIMNLYANGVFNHKKAKSLSFPELVRQPDQLTLLKKHIQTQDFKRQFIENEKSKQIPVDSSKRKIVMVTNCLQAYAPSTYTKRNKKPKFQSIKQRKTASLQSFSNKSHQKKKIENNPQLPLLERRKKIEKVPKLQKIPQINDLNPWQSPVKWRITSQQSILML